MKVHVVYDTRGNIISIHDLRPETTEAGAPQYGVVLEGNRQSADVDIPAKYGELGLIQVAERLRVSTTRGVPVLVDK